VDARPPTGPWSIAANRLVALGYTDVREYAEGIADWIDAGLPVEGEVGAAV
jgi:rhodanese-related sulfurtransferase